MLQYLHIENIAVIESANIDFTTGFNVMTGETGAGKSIIIDSLYAILGERTSRDLIRTGCERAVVSASFSNVNGEALKTLENLGIGYDPVEELVLSRVMFADGRGQVKINSQPANVSALKELGKHLINIHGQHDNQTLLDPDTHISYIDSFAENGSLKKEYISAFEEFRRINKQLDDAIKQEEESIKKAELLKYQTDELSKAEIKIGEEEKLKAYLKSYSMCEKTASVLETVLNEIYGGTDESFSALDKLRAASSALSQITNENPKAEKALEKAESVIADVESLVSDISEIKENLNFSEIDAENARQRLDLLHDLMLKYNCSEEGLINYLESASDKLQSIVKNSEARVKLESLIEPAEKRLIECGKRLSDSRKKAADEICRLICNELKALNFNSAVFTAEIKQGRYTKNGCDTTEFLISANAGELPKPLAKVASGGELSRIMLAIRSVLSMKDDVGTLIFDEIDSGISGKTAAKVAEKLYNVSKKGQVICVTHLAQIASKADNHLYICKSEQGGKTFTTVKNLDFEGRVYEIARILSGGEYTENVINTAREMLK